MDNELSNAERSMVESFAQNNPDLKDELDILLQSKLVPDNNIVFESKEDLMKVTNDSIITLDNYEEWLTLYIDNELNIEQKNQVERFVVAHSQVQNELSVLQKAKLQPEEIVFPYKESLYRQTEKVRVVQMRWWRVAAAAVLLIAIGATAVLVLNKKKQPEQPVVSTPTKNDQNITGENSGVKKTNNEGQNPQPTISPDDKSSIVQTPEQKQNNKTNVKNKLPDNLPIKKEEQEIADNNNDKPSNNLPQPLDNPNVKGNSTVDIAKADHQDKNIIPPQTNDNSVTKSEANSSITNETASGKEKDNPNVVFTSSKDITPLDEGGQNKSSRGFFRKAFRFLEKTTGIKPANDDDRVLIGGLAVKLK